MFGIWSGRQFMTGTVHLPLLRKIKLPTSPSCKPYDTDQIKRLKNILSAQ